MALTGYMITVYMDANPYSETYGQERTERVQDTEDCPVQLPSNYVQVYTYCEMTPNGAYTGNCVAVFEDVEPLSPTYGEQYEVVSQDHVLCEPDSSEADWQVIDTYCEQIAYQPSGKLGNSGYMITVYQDMGEFSPTYGMTRETKTQDIVHCQQPNTEPVWIETRWECHLENGVQDGTKDVWMVNTNEYSPEYAFGEETLFNVEDTVNCPRSEYAPNWVETSYVCETVDGYNTGNIIITETDTNQNSQTYNQTRTRTEEDLERCPYQEPSLLRWRIINNRSASTDTITNITLHFNNSFDISAIGSIAPAGGSINGSLVIPSGLKSTSLVCQSITLSPNTALPVLYQFSQNPNPYVWDNDGSDTLIVTLWDGDGTGPEWTEISYTCETVGGYRTGSSTVVEEDTNPNSATYGQQRTRVIEYDPRCPAQTDAVWVETSYSCQTESGYNTGYAFVVQTDTNPNSSTYGSTRTRLVQDLVRCPLDTTAAWTEVSYVCEQQDGFNTGNTIITERDVNPGSATYNQTRTRTVSDDPRCVRDTNPNWVIESWVCEQVNTEPVWVETSRTCVTESGYNTGYATVVETDENPDSATYGQTRTSTVQDLVNCPIPALYKLRYTLSNGNTGEVSCDSGNYLGSSVVPTLNLRTADIGTCVQTIGRDAFKNRLGLTSITIPDTITSIEVDAFSYSGVGTSVYISDITAWCNINFFTNTSVPFNSGHLYLNGSEVTNLVLPNTVSSISSWAFFRCDGLTSVTIPNTVNSINNSVFGECHNIASVTIPNSVTSIGPAAFRACTSLTSVTIPNSVTSIATNAFYNCTSLTTVTCLATTPPNLDNEVFFNTDANLVIYVPAASVSAYQSASGWSDYASRIQAIPNS